MNIKRLMAIEAVVVAALLMMAGAAMADTVTTDFNSFTLGTVNGQDGWKSGGLSIQYDQAVVANGVGVPAAFGTQSLRISNAVTSSEFSYQTYSKSTTIPASESGNTEFDATFSFTSTSATQQAGLKLSISPDSYEGSRMSYVRLEDQADGIHVFIDDTPMDGLGYTWRETDAGVVLDRTTAHTIRFWIKLIPGENNDIVRIFIDGVDIGDELGVCFTTWENYYRLDPEQTPAPNYNNPPALNSLQFRSAGLAAPSLSGQGYLFDNVSITTANGTGPAPGNCGDIGAFCSPGFWKNASEAAWALTGTTKAALFNTEVVPGFYANLINPSTTLEDVLTAKGANTYGKAAGPFDLNPFNAVGAALTSAIPGYVFDPDAYALSLLGIDTCPLDNHGNLIAPG